MELKIEKDIAKNEIVYTLKVYQEEFEFTKLDQFELRLMDECSKSDKISDTLLALECLARRREEQDVERDSRR